MCKKDEKKFCTCETDSVESANTWELVGKVSIVGDYAIDPGTYVTGSIVAPGGEYVQLINPNEWTFDFDYEGQDGDTLTLTPIEGESRVFTRKGGKWTL